jgi:hypothetical protein
MNDIRISLQGIRWIRNKEGTKERNLEIMRLGQNTLIRKLSVALENGWSVLIENIGESIDAVLNPVIQRAGLKRGKKYFLKIGDSEVRGVVLSYNDPLTTLLTLSVIITMQGLTSLFLCRSSPG